MDRKKHFRQPERRLTDEPEYLQVHGPLDPLKSRTFELESPVDAKR